MNPIDSCPSCYYDKQRKLHSLTIKNVYDKKEISLAKRNDFERNWILFKKILNGIDSISVDFIQCLRCGLIFFSPRPDDDDLAKKYEYIVESRTTERREQKHKLVDLRERRSNEIYKRLRSYFDVPPQSALDIGGTDGHCLSAFGGSVRRSVLDFEIREMWQGTERVGSTLSDLKPDQRFDIVLCCHTLEHIPDISEFIKGIYQVINKNGLLYLEVPMGVSGEIFRTRNILTHLNFFSKASLTFFLENAGFKVENCLNSPVLSSKRYLDVVFAIARKVDETDHIPESSDLAYVETRREMNKRNKIVLAVKNISLIVSHPVEYAIIFFSRMINNQKKF